MPRLHKAKSFENKACFNFQQYHKVHELIKLKGRINATEQIVLLAPHTNISKMCSSPSPIIWPLNTVHNKNLISQCNLNLHQTSEDIRNLIADINLDDSLL